MCYSLGGSRGPPVVLALLCFALCLTFFFLGQEFLRRPGEGTRMGVLSVCLGALVRPCWLSLRSDCGLVAPCPQASHPAGPDPRRSGFPSCVPRFFGSWRRAAAVFVLLFVKILLDIHPLSELFPQSPRRPCPDRTVPARTGYRAPSPAGAPPRNPAPIGGCRQSC